MEINNEQLKKLLDLSDIETLPEEAVPEDINKALIAIERKLNSFIFAFIKNLINFNLICFNNK